MNLSGDDKTLWTRLRDASWKPDKKGFVYGGRDRNRLNKLGPGYPREIVWWSIQYQGTYSEGGWVFIKSSEVGKDALVMAGPFPELYDLMAQPFGDCPTLAELCGVCIHDLKSGAIVIQQVADTVEGLQREIAQKQWAMERLWAIPEWLSSPAPPVKNELEVVSCGPFNYPAWSGSHPSYITQLSGNHILYAIKNFDLTYESRCAFELAKYQLGEDKALRKLIEMTRNYGER